MNISTESKKKKRETYQQLKIFELCTKKKFNDSHEILLTKQACCFLSEHVWNIWVTNLLKTIAKKKLSINWFTSFPFCWDVERKKTHTHKFNNSTRKIHLHTFCLYCPNSMKVSELDNIECLTVQYKSIKVQWNSLT